MKRKWKKKLNGLEKKNQILKISVICFALIFLLCFESCASKNIVPEKMDLYGLVIDENNQPVQDFIVRCRKSTEKKEYSTLSGENGLFIFNEMKGGEYFVYGEKNGFAKLAEEKYEINVPQKMICIQVSSIDNVLNNVEKQVSLGNNQKALELLDEIKYQSGSCEEYVVENYRLIIEEIN